jgi:hypothetical protein
MSNEDLTIAFTVEQSPEEAFAAIIGGTCPGDCAGAVGYGDGMGCMGCFAVTAA